MSQDDKICSDVDDWQLAETAPKDGTRIDVAYVDDGYLHRDLECYWVSDKRRKEGGYWWDPHADEGWGDRLHSWWTHWRPSPTVFDGQRVKLCE